ncbi:MAG: hypothetical protein RXN89_05230, partial [Vulcanisaeta sp.]
MGCAIIVHALLVGINSLGVTPRMLVDVAISCPSHLIRICANGSGKFSESLTTNCAYFASTIAVNSGP